MPRQTALQQTGEIPWKHMPADVWMLVFAYLDFEAIRLLSFLHASNFATGHALFWRLQFRRYFPALYEKMKVRDEDARVDWYLEFNHAEKEECDDCGSNKRSWFHGVKESVYLLDKENLYEKYLKSTQDKCYAMIRACKGGHLAVVKALVEEDVCFARMQYPPTQEDAYHYFWESSRAILLKSLHKEDRRYPLAIAAAYGHVDIVAYLIEKGARR